MLKIMRHILGVIVVVLAGYGLIMKDFSFSSYMILFMSAFMLVLGLSKFKENRREDGLGFMFVSLCTFVVALVMIFL